MHLYCNVCFSQNLQRSVDKDSISQKIKTFYWYYIEKSFDELCAYTKLSKDTMSKYCTKSFLKKEDRIFNDPDEELDPLFPVQSVAENWKKTLEVTKVINNMYKLCIYYSYDKNFFCINIFIKTENGLWKIDSVKKLN